MQQQNQPSASTALYHHTVYEHCLTSLGLSSAHQATQLAAAVEKDRAANCEGCALNENIQTSEKTSKPVNESFHMCDVNDDNDSYDEVLDVPAAWERVVFISFGIGMSSEFLVAKHCLRAWDLHRAEDFAAQRLRSAHLNSNSSPDTWAETSDRGYTTGKDIQLPVPLAPFLALALVLGDGSVYDYTNQISFAVQQTALFEDMFKCSPIFGLNQSRFDDVTTKSTTNTEEDSDGSAAINWKNRLGTLLVTAVDTTAGVERRSQAYAKGGIIVLKAPTFVADVLARRLDPSLISAVTIVDAHNSLPSGGMIETPRLVLALLREFGEKNPSETAETVRIEKSHNGITRVVHVHHNLETTGKCHSEYASFLCRWKGTLWHLLHCMRRHERIFVFAVTEAMPEMSERVMKVLNPFFITNCPRCSLFVKEYFDMGQQISAARSADCEGSSPVTVTECEVDSITRASWKSMQLLILEALQEWHEGNKFQHEKNKTGNQRRSRNEKDDWGVSDEVRIEWQRQKIALAISSFGPFVSGCFEQVLTSACTTELRSIKGRFTLTRRAQVARTLRQLKSLYTTWIRGRPMSSARLLRLEAVLAHTTATSHPLWLLSSAATTYYQSARDAVYKVINDNKSNQSHFGGDCGIPDHSERPRVVQSVVLDQCLESLRVFVINEAQRMVSSETSKETNAGSEHQNLLPRLRSRVLFVVAPSDRAVSDVVDALTAPSVPQLRKKIFTKFIHEYSERLVVTQRSISTGKISNTAAAKKGEKVALAGADLSDGEIAVDTDDTHTANYWEEGGHFESDDEYVCLHEGSVVPPPHRDLLMSMASSADQITAKSVQPGSWEYFASDEEVQHLIPDEDEVYIAKCPAATVQVQKSPDIFIHLEHAGVQSGLATATGVYSTNPATIPLPCPSTAGAKVPAILRWDTSDHANLFAPVAVYPFSFAALSVCRRSGAHATSQREHLNFRVVVIPRFTMTLHFIAAHHISGMTSWVMPGSCASDLLLLRRWELFTVMCTQNHLVTVEKVTTREEKSELKEPKLHEAGSISSVDQVKVERLLSSCAAPLRRSKKSSTTGSDTRDVIEIMSSDDEPITIPVNRKIREAKKSLKKNAAKATITRSTNTTDNSLRIIDHHKMVFRSIRPPPIHFITYSATRSSSDNSDTPGNWDLCPSAAVLQATRKAEMAALKRLADLRAKLTAVESISANKRRQTAVEIDRAPPSQQRNNQERYNQFDGWTLLRRNRSNIEQADGSKRYTSASTGYYANDSSSRILFDTRELRAALPAYLFFAGHCLVPLLLLRGDYIISPSIAVERKAIADLIQSLQSGRLWQQLQSLSRLYPLPVLLLEGDESRPYAAQWAPYARAADLEKENFASGKRVQLLSGQSVPAVSWVIAKLCRVYMALQSTMLSNSIQRRSAEERWTNVNTPMILWARSPSHAATLLGKLKSTAIGCQEPDPSDPSLTSTAVESASEDQRRATMILHRLPGINSQNAQAVMNVGGSLAGVATLSLETLEQTMESKNDAALLYNFFQHKHH